MKTKWEDLDKSEPKNKKRKRSCSDKELPSPEEEIDDFQK